MGLHCGPVIGGIVGVNLPRCVRSLSLPLPPFDLSNASNTYVAIFALISENPLFNHVGSFVLISESNSSALAYFGPGIAFSGIR